MDGRILRRQERTTIDYQFGPFRFGKFDSPKSMVVPPATKYDGHKHELQIGIRSRILFLELLAADDLDSPDHTYMNVSTSDGFRGANARRN